MSSESGTGAAADRSRCRVIGRPMSSSLRIWADDDYDDENNVCSYREKEFLLYN